MSETKALFACPCCDYLTLTDRGKYEICTVCFWEDDGTQIPEDFSMPNHLFLAQGQQNFLTLGACDERAVSFVKKEARSQYKKQDYNAFNHSAPDVHTNPFVEFLKGIKNNED